MGCVISAPDPFLQASVTSTSAGLWTLGFNDPIVFTCGNGRTLSFYGTPADSHAFTCQAIEETNYDFDFLQCVEPTPELTTAAPSAAPTVSPSGDGGNRTLGTPPPIMVEEPDEETSDLFQPANNYVECLIPSIEGILAYQAAEDAAQASLVQYPISIIDDSVFYNVPSHESIVFACKNLTDKLKWGGRDLGVGFYPYHCQVEEGSAEEERGFNLPLSCEAPTEEGVRRYLR